MIMTTIIFKVSNFIPFDFAFNEIKKSLETILTNNTFSIHHFNGGWLNGQARQARTDTMEKYNQIVKRME